MANYILDYTGPQVNTKLGLTIPTDISDLTDEGRLIPTVPETVSSFTNDAGYLTSFTETDPTVPSWAKEVSKPSYTASEVGAVAKTGDTMSGDLTFENSKGIVLQYANTTDSFYLMGSGPNYGIASFGIETELRNIKTPTMEKAATNKSYVDNKDTIKITGGSDNTEYNLIGVGTTVSTSAVNVYRQSLISASKSTNFTRLTIGSTSIPGEIRIYSSAANASGYTDLKSLASSTNERIISFPDASGTVALTSDIPSISSWALASSKPSYTFSELTSHPTTLGDYGITDAYTKTEVDGLVSGVLHYKGTKATVSALPNSGNVTGDVWHITADGSEYAWDGSTWQELGTATDLSGYVPTSRTINGKALSENISLTASDVSALPSSTTYVSSFNGSSGAITYTAPVTSVNGQTGAVTLNIPAAVSVTNTLTTGTLIATINGTNIYAPAYTDADGVSY